MTETLSAAAISGLIAPKSTAPAADPQSRTEAVDFHGQKRTIATHAATTDADARLHRNGPPKIALT
jgi:hypothetical protein